MTGNRRAGLIAGLIFIAGLLVGWLGIGWGLWPVQQSNSAPWLMRAEYQRQYVAMVAAEYARSGDMAQARAALDGWDGESLAELLSHMRVQAATFEERQQVTKLAEVLALPVSGESFWVRRVGREVGIWFVLAAALPLTGALGLLVVSLVQRFGEGAAGQPAPALVEIEAELAEILAAEEPVTPQSEPAAAIDDRPVDEVLAEIFGRRAQTLAFYESLCQDLEEISVTDLARKARRVVEQIRNSDVVYQ